MNSVKHEINLDGYRILKINSGKEISNKLQYKIYMKIIDNYTKNHLISFKTAIIHNIKVSFIKK